MLPAPWEEYVSMISIQTGFLGAHPSGLSGKRTHLVKLSKNSCGLLKGQESGPEGRAAFKPKDKI